MQGKIAGIYLIRNIINNNIYIGSSININRRISGHFSQLRRNKHYNWKLIRDYKKYGEKSFCCEIIRYVKDITRLKEHEQYYLDNLHPYYNILKDAYASGKLRHTDEIKAEISKARSGKGNGMYGRKHTPEALEKIAIASYERRNNPEVLAALAIGQQWNKGKSFSESTRQKMSDAKPKKDVNRICLITGDVKNYPSIRSVKNDGFSVSHVGECCKNLAKTHKGYKWEYATK